MPKAQEILNRKYFVHVVREEEGFSASIKEFPGCVAQGDTLQETLDNIDDAAESWVEAALEQNFPIPMPIPTTWNLWLDDVRDPASCLKHHEFMGRTCAKNPEYQGYIDDGLRPNNVIWAKTAHEAIELVKVNGMPKYMALDHDLGDHTVFSFLNYLTMSNQVAPHPAFWRVHSANIEGAKNIKAFLRSWYKST